MSLAGSLAEARELYSLLQQIVNQLEKMGIKPTAEARERIHDVFVTTSQLIMIMRRIENIMRTLNLDPDLEASIQQLQRFTYTAMIAYRSIILLQSATPYGWIMGLLGFGVLTAQGVAYGNQLASEAERYVGSV